MNLILRYSRWPLLAGNILYGDRPITPGAVRGKLASPFASTSGCSPRSDQVLGDIVEAKGMTEAQAVLVIENVLFHTSNKLYGLGLAS
jgi:hypothetical protein